MKRLFDILSSFIGLVLVSPFMLLIAVIISIDSKGGVFYLQERIGRHGVPFLLFKFRTMRPDSDKLMITVGHRDPRVTRIGYFLRKYKLDELPQLINILKGEMSVVGPRPEVRKYVEMYSAEQRNVLSVRPGLTDLSTLEYVDESELLKEAENPEKMYVEEIMPEKLALNLRYIKTQSFFGDIKIILQTLFRIIR